MNLFSSFKFLINGKKSPSHVTVTQTEKTIDSKLKNVLSNKVRIECYMPLFFTDIDATTVMIEYLNHDNGRFIITDHLLPEEAQRKIKSDKDLFLGFFLYGVPHAFKTKLYKNMQSKQALAFYAPSTIYMVQRRKHFRLTQAAMKDKIFVEFFYKNFKYHLPLFDISAGGLSFYSYFSTTEMQKNISEKDGTEECSINIIFPNRIIRAAIVIRNALPVKKTSYLSRVCAQFSDIHHESLQFIHNYVNLHQK